MDHRAKIVNILFQQSTNEYFTLKQIRLHWQK